MSSNDVAITPFKAITADDYTYLFGDFDNDGTLNVDDPFPNDPTRKMQFEEVRLSDEIRELIDLRDDYSEVLDKVMDKLRKINPNGIVKGRVKSPFSIINKLRRKRIRDKVRKAEQKGELYTKGLTDMAGTMLLVNSFAEVQEAVKTIKQQFDVFEHENFYKDPNNGYRAHHYIVNEGGLLVEIQLKTERLSKVSSAAHTPYKAGNLDGKAMLELTTLANKADKGDTEAANKIDALLKKPQKLSDRLTQRKNPAVEDPEVLDDVLDDDFEGGSKSESEEEEYNERFERLKKDYTEIVALYAKVLQKKGDSIADSKISKANAIMEQLGEMFGVDFFAALKQAKEKQAESQESTTIQHITDDIRLKNFSPIKMTKGQRKKANETALKVLEKDDLEITQSDREKLRKYTGAGGVGYAADDVKSGLLNEHYTSYTVIKWMWMLMKKLGVKGTVLEPGSGIGNFAGFRPKDYEMVMVERSPISARIAKLLYPNQIIKNINFAQFDPSIYNFNGFIGNVPFGNFSIHGRFEAKDFGKAPIHDYFILKSLKALNTGGIGIVVTSTGTMDKKNNTFRQNMIKYADFLGAIRLPSSAFKANASTDVTTDVLVFQRKPDSKAQEISKKSDLFAHGELEKVDVGVNPNTGEQEFAFYNAFYREHPQNIVGEHIAGHKVGPFMTRMGVKGDLNDKILNNLKPFIAKPRFEVPTDKGVIAADVDGVALNVNRRYPNSAIILHKDKFYEKNNNTFKKIEIAKSDADRVVSALDMLDAHQDFITALAQETEDIEEKRHAFRKATDNHIDDFGLPDEDERLAKIFKFDPRLYKMTAFAKRDPDTGEVVYADIYDKREMYSKEYMPELDNNEDLGQIAVFLHANGEEISLDSVQSVYKGGTETKAVIERKIKAHQDYYFNPITDRYDFKYEFLSGNVRKKWHALNEYEGYEKEKKALKDVMPEELTVYDISLSPTHIYTYMPVDIVESWIDKKTNARADISIIRSEELDQDMLQLGDIGKSYFASDRVTLDLTDSFRGTKLDKGANSADIENGWDGVPFSKIAEVFIKRNNFPFVAVDGEGERIGISKTKLEDAAKKEAREGSGDYYRKALDTSRRRQTQNNTKMQKTLQPDFERYVRTEISKDDKKRVEKEYNDRYNHRAKTPFDGSTISVRGMSNSFYGVNNFTIYKHNKMVAEKLAWHGQGGNFHDVGAGKTIATLLLATMQKQRGIMNKPMFVVPAKVQKKWVEEHMMLFPDAKILSLDLQADTRKKELALAQMYDWDAIYINEFAFARLPLSPKVEKGMIEKRLDYYDEVVEEYVSTLDPTMGKRAKKQMEKEREKLEGKINDLNNVQRDEADVFFDEMGIDGIIVDEAHNYKNAIGSPLAQKLGIAGSVSQRAEDMLIKTRYLRNRIGNKNVYVLTATPVVNSPIEIWHMLNLCAPDLLKKYNIENMDNFISTFVTWEQKIVRKTTGDFDTQEVVSGYINLPEMQSVIDEVTDVKSYDQLIDWYDKNPDIITKADGTKTELKPKFKRPSAVVKDEIIDQSDVHKLMFEDIMLRAVNVIEAMQSGNEPNDNFLVITADGSLISTDLRLYSEQFRGFDHESLKVKRLAQNVWNYYNKAAEKFRENPLVTDRSTSIYGNFFTQVDKDRPPRRNPEIANQIIFSDPTNLRGGGSFHILIKEKLVEKGIPEEEIAIISGQYIGLDKNGNDRKVKGSDDKNALKQKVSDDFNNGRFRVVIGNKSIAEGMNLQKWTVAQHHLDIPYTPSALQQRNGRGVRQGNQYNSVDVLYYLMKDSFDSRRLDIIIKKQNWIDQLFTSTEERKKRSEDTDESLSYEEMQSAIASDPRIKNFYDNRQKMKLLETEVDQLSQDRASLQGKAQLFREDFVTSKKTKEKVVARNEELIEPPDRIDDVTEDQFDVTALQNSEFGERKLKLRVRWFDGVVEFPVNLRNATGATNNTSFELKFTRVLAENGKQLNIKESYFDDFMGEFYTDNPRYLLRIESSEMEELQETNTETVNGDTQIGFNFKDKLQDARVEQSKKKFIRLADMEDLESKAGVSVSEIRERTKKENGKPTTYKEIKKNVLGADNINYWLPIVKDKIKRLMLSMMQKHWNTKDHRIELIEEQISDNKKKAERVDKRLLQIVDDFEQKEQQLKKAREKDRNLISIVEKLTERKFDSRAQVYEKLNQIRHRYGIKYKLIPKVVGEETILRKNPDNGGMLVYLGRTERFIATNNHYVADSGRDPDYMFADKDFTELLIVPPHRVKDITGKEIKDKKAKERFEEWSHYPSSNQQFEITLPDGTPEKVGTAKQIFYASDKVMQSGDRKGKDNRYVHDFDPGKRPVYELEDVIQVKKLKIDKRGILN